MKKLSFFLSALIAFGGSAFAQDNYTDTDYVKVVTDDGVEAAVATINSSGVFDVFVMHDWSIANRLNKEGIKVNNYQAADNNPLTWGAGGNITFDAWPTGIFSLQEHGLWQLGNNNEYDHHVKAFRITWDEANQNGQWWAGAYLNNTVARDFSHVNPDTHIHAIVYTDTDHQLYNWNVNFKFLRYDIPGGDDPNCAKMRLRQDYWDPNGLPWIGSMKGLSWGAIDITIGQIEKLMVESGLQFDYTRLNNNANFQHILAIETPSGQDDSQFECKEAQFAIDGVYMYTPSHTEANTEVTAVKDDASDWYYATYSNTYSDVELQASGAEEIEVLNVNVSGNILDLTKRANNWVARGEAVLVRTKAATFNAVPNNQCTLTPAADNLLVATPALAATVKKDSNNNLYRLAYNNNSNKTGLGFYWGDAEGTLINATPNKGYLKVPVAQAAAIQGFAINPKPTHVEGIEIEDASQLNEPVYDLSGRRVENPTSGFYLQAGKKIIVK